MTSDQLFKKNDLVAKLRYLITGEGGLRLPINCSVYSSVEDADLNAINRALDLAKVFTGITLHRIMDGQKKEVVLRSRKPKSSKEIVIHYFGKN